MNESKPYREIPLVIFDPKCVSRNDDTAIILYTSGTTGNPKGVQLSYSNLIAQAVSIVKAWKYDTDLRCLHVLPVNHIHGIMNTLLSVFWAGGTVEFGQSSAPEYIWNRIMSNDSKLMRINMLSAVPTLYNKMLLSSETLFDTEEKRKEMREHLKNFRLMMSGSSALLPTTKRKWLALTGVELLERYGMTETGMILTCPLQPLSMRFDSSVGWPMPDVEVKIVDDGQEVTEKNKIPGEIYVKGRTVFKGYWRRPELSAKSFDNGWFKTGDFAYRDFSSANGAFFIKGRLNIDIINHGGFKVSVSSCFY